MIKILRHIIDALTTLFPKGSLAISYHFFTSPREGKIVGDLPPFLAQAVKQKIYIGKEYVQTYKIGFGKQTMLLLHGWESNANRWEQLVKYLGDSYTFVCMDAPAMGKSSGKEFNALKYSEFIDLCLGTFKPQIVISHSLGGFAYLYQLSKNEYSFLEKNILLGCLDEFEHIVENYQNIIGFSDASYLLLKEKLETMTGNSLSEYRSSLFSKKNKLSTFIVQDVTDEIIPLKSAYAIYENTEKGTLFLTENIGHSLQDEKVYKKIQDFIVS